jgi:hypothetical protein
MFQIEKVAMNRIKINGIGRAILATTFGLLAGFGIGSLGPTIIVAWSAWYRRAHWSHSDWADQPYSVVVWSELTGKRVPYWFAIGVIGALNGALGARNGLHSDARRLWPVCVGLLLLLLYPLVEFVRYPNAGEIGVGALVLAIFMAPFVWVAGRVGQEIGVACRRPADKSTC